MIGNGRLVARLFGRRDVRSWYACVHFEMGAFKALHREKHDPKFPDAHAVCPEIATGLFCRQAYAIWTAAGCTRYRRVEIEWAGLLIRLSMCRVDDCAILLGVVLRAIFVASVAPGQ